MQILDDNIIHQVTYSSECQATFNKYKSKLIQNLVLNGITLLAVVSYFIYSWNLIPDTMTIAEKFNTMTASLIIGGIAFVVLFLHFMRAFFDLKAKRLDIQTDIFIKLALEKNDNQTDYNIYLQDAGGLGQPPVIRNIKKGSPVYVIRTGFSKTLLDIIPVESVKS